MAVVCIVNVGVFVFIWVGDKCKILEGKALGEIHLALCAGVYRITIERDITDIRTVGSKRYIIAVCGRAHGKHITAARYKVTYLFSDSQFQLRHLFIAVLCGHGLCGTLIVLVPWCIVELCPEFSILSRK